MCLGQSSDRGINPDYLIHIKKNPDHQMFPCCLLQGWMVCNWGGLAVIRMERFVPVRSLTMNMYIHVVFWTGEQFSIMQISRLIENYGFIKCQCYYISRLLSLQDSSSPSFRQGISRRSRLWPRNHGSNHQSGQSCCNTVTAFITLMMMRQIVDHYCCFSLVISYY